MLGDAVEKVRQFQKHAGQCTNELPTLIPRDLVNRRAKWISEELHEFIIARNIYEQADAITDLLYYVLGAYVEAGIDPDPVFMIVHNSNMKKLDKGVVVKESDGKVMKPVGWSHPDIEVKMCIDNQMVNKEK